jgi:all-trans-8'-apo-beta-carotenal 15,15'-oxygenase
VRSAGSAPSPRILTSTRGRASCSGSACRSCHGPIDCFRVDRAGRLHRIRQVRLPRLFANHDFGLTDRYLVFAVDPLEVRRWPFVVGARSMAESVRYRPELGTRFILVPRDGGPPRTVEHDALLHFHVTNAFDDDGDVVLELIDFDGFEIWRNLFRYRTSDLLVGTTLKRIRITPSDRVLVEDLCDWQVEFPRVDPRRAGRRHRFTYCAGRPGGAPSGQPTAVVKVDHELGANSIFDLGDGHLVGEPVFVPSSPSGREDDGWLLAVAYDAVAHRSSLLVLDAYDLDDGPVATVELPFAVSPGFHGSFTRGSRDPTRVSRSSSRARR